MISAKSAQEYFTVNIHLTQAASCFTFIIDKLNLILQVLLRAAAQVVQTPNYHSCHIVINI